MGYVAKKTSMEFCKYMDYFFYNEIESESGSFVATTERP
jgi:hypothetical protein